MWQTQGAHARTHAQRPTPLPLQPLPHHVMGGSGLFTVATDTSGAGKLWKHHAPHIPLAFRTDAQRRGKGEGEMCRPGWGGVGVLGWLKPAVKRSNAHAHMLNATYIWYSSIASTNCPHESKSVPFLKLACHFWMVLLTSDMLAGRILAALSGQHSRGGDASTGLQLRRQRCSGQRGYLLAKRAQWHSDQALSAWSP